MKWMMKTGMAVTAAAMFLALVGCSREVGRDGTVQETETSAALTEAVETAAEEKTEYKRAYNQYWPMIKSGLEKRYIPEPEAVIWTSKLRPFLYEASQEQKDGLEGGIEGTFLGEELQSYRLVVQESGELYYCCYYDFGEYEYLTYRTTLEDKDQIPNFMCWEKSCILSSPLEQEEYDKKYAFRDSGAERSFLVYENMLYVMDHDKKSLYPSVEEEQQMLCSWLFLQKERLETAWGRERTSPEAVERNLPDGYTLYSPGDYVTADFNMDELKDILVLTVKEEEEESSLEDGGFSEIPIQEEPDKQMWLLLGQTDGRYRPMKLWNTINWNEDYHLKAIFPAEGEFMLEYENGKENQAYDMEYSYEVDMGNWYLSRIYHHSDSQVFAANQKELGMIPVTDGGMLLEPKALTFRDDNLQKQIEEIVEQDFRQIRQALEKNEDFQGSQVTADVAYQNSRMVSIRYDVEKTLEDHTTVHRQLYSDIDLFSGEKIDFHNLFTYEEFMEVCATAQTGLGMTARMYSKVNDMDYMLQLDYPCISLSIGQYGLNLQLDMEDGQTHSRLIPRSQLLSWPVTDYWDDMP